MHAATVTSRVVLAALTLLLTACGDGVPSRVDFRIDNPTEASIAIRIDADTYEIAPNTSKEVSLSPGVHQLQSAATGEVEFMVYGLTNSRGVLMNPTFSPYVQVRQTYATDDKAARGFGAIERTIALDGVEFTGTYELREGLFISRNWRFDLDQEFPETLVVHRNSSDSIRSGAITDKLFRKLDFVRYVEATYDEEGRYQAERQPPTPPIASYPDFGTQHVFKHAGVEAATQPLKHMSAAYLETTDPAEAARLQASYFDLQIAFTSATAAKVIELETSERPAYNGFVKSITQLMSTEARVLPPKE